MQQVSPEWKAAHQQAILPKACLSIQCKISVREAQRSASISAQGEDFCSPEQILEETEKQLRNYANLELNTWVLNGKGEYLPQDTSGADTGYISSQICGDDCLFDANPVIRLEWASATQQPIPGVTIVWSSLLGQMAREFEVTFWRQGGPIARKRVTRNIQVICPVELPVEEYDALTIEVIEWCLPGCRVRVSDVLMGINTVWNDEQILKYEAEQSVDLLSAALPQSTIRFTVDNILQQFNPDDSRGLSRFLAEQQEVQVQYGLKLGSAIQWIDGGKYFLSKWEAPQNGISAEFSAQSILGLMNQRYTGPLTGTLQSIAQAAVAQAQLPDGFEVFLSDALEAFEANITESYDHTIAETLQLLAHAGMCVFSIDRQGNLHIMPLVLKPTDYKINAHNSYQRGEYTLSQPVGKVVVGDGLGEYSLNSTGEIIEIRNPFIQSSAHAEKVALWAANLYHLRKNVGGEYRADLRADLLDMILVENKYAQNSALLTSLKFSYHGAFSGTYTAKVLFTNGTSVIYLGECYAGEIL